MNCLKRLENLPIMFFHKNKLKKCVFLPPLAEFRSQLISFYEIFLWTFQLNVAKEIFFPQNDTHAHAKISVFAVIM